MPTSQQDPPDNAPARPAQRQDQGSGASDDVQAESSIEARRAAAAPNSDEISGDTPDSQMPQI